MKVLLLNGSPHKKGATYTALTEVKNRLESHGVESDIVHVRHRPLQPCTACGKCRTLGKCVFEDQVTEVHAAMENYDALIVGSPVHYAAATGQITTFLDRLFYSGNAALSGKPGASVVSCRRGGSIAAFDQLNKYFLINNMPLIPSNYWNQVHGNTPDEVKQDKEGMQTMRTLADNAAWMLKCIEHGKNAGINKPAYEERIATNFIR